ncbi:hypothetical protein [Lactiplantibacillus paraxiangfangensis]|uniref:hypothetical protein n=1 Tax=Lactiplantibacillus paraxiangfangensis TaxID=3076224 RepID=UPI0030C6F611
MKNENLIPSVVSEFIDESILPDLSDGERSARKITQIVVEQAHSWLTDEAEGRNPIGDDKCLTYCWVIACKLHRDLMIEYIERAFELFGEG